ncbi:MAG: cell division FtsZ family protein [Muribaculaceae bacterium]|nr:cell division FtsZ family protein [Muribaculaceae bacterium]
MDKNQFGTIITVMGVGGGGINAVNHMYSQGIDGVTFVVSDTDKHQLDESPVPNLLLLSANTTHEQSSCYDVDVARRAAVESDSEIAPLIADNNTKLLIIIAGLGGETGTNVAPVVTRIAREKEVALTVGIVTTPFQFEGSERIQMALAGIEDMRKHVDSLFVINNQYLTEIYNDLDQSNAFAKSDETLTTAVRSLCDLITVKNLICIDFNDVNWTLRKSGSAMFISGYASGERRVTKAIENALESPLLKDCNIFSAKKMMMNFYYNPDSESPLLMEEMNEVQAFMSNFDQDTDIIWGIAYDNTLEDQLKVTVLASGFNVSYNSKIAGTNR